MTLMMILIIKERFQIEIIVDSGRVSGYFRLMGQETDASMFENEIFKAMSMS